MDQVSTVSTGIMNTMLGICIVSIAVPVIAAVVFGKKAKSKAFPVLFGMITFLLIEMMARTLAISGILNIATVSDFFSKNPMPYQFFLSFTVILFEEPIRLLIFKTTLKSYTDDNSAIAFGIGFGGIACLISCGIGMISSLITASAANVGVYDSYSAEELSDLIQASAAISAYKPAELIAECVRYMSDIVMQAAFSFIIVRGIRFGTVLPCFLINAAGHFLYCAAPGLLGYAPAGVIIGALFCSVIATCMIYYMAEAIRRYDFYEKNKGADL